MISPRGYQCPPAHAGGHCPLGRGLASNPGRQAPTRAAVPEPYRPAHRPALWTVGRAGRTGCPTVPVPVALCPVVVSLPMVAAVLAMPGRQPTAGQPTPGNRATDRPVTVPSVLLCSLVIRCASAPTVLVRLMWTDHVGNRPQWLITGRCLAGYWSPVGLTRIIRERDADCARGATTGQPQSTRPPVAAADSDQGGNPPLARPARSSSRPVGVSTSYRQVPGAEPDGD